MAKKQTFIQDVSKEFSKDLNIIEDARIKENKREIEYSPKNRIGGLKVALWFAFIWLGYKAYSLSPLKDDLNRIFEDDIF